MERMKLTNSATQLKGTQLDRVRIALEGGTWLTLPELNRLTGDPVSSISAQMRHLRKPEHGSRTITKRRRGKSESGLFEYRLLPTDSQIEEILSNHAT